MGRIWMCECYILNFCQIKAKFNYRLLFRWLCPFHRFLRIFYFIFCCSDFDILICYFMPTSNKTKVAKPLFKTGPSFFFLFIGVSSRDAEIAFWDQNTLWFDSLNWDAFICLSKETLQCLQLLDKLTGIEQISQLDIS